MCLGAQMGNRWQPQVTRRARFGTHHQVKGNSHCSTLSRCIVCGGTQMGQKLATASHDNNCKIWTPSFLLPENQRVASACLWREKMLGAGDFPFNEVFFPGDLSVTGFSLFSWLRLIGLTQFLSEKLQKLDFSVLIRQALARFGPEILINSDALGNNCLDLATDNAIERQDHAEITTFLKSDILNAVASDMFRACKSGFVNSLDIAVSYLLEHQKLATLKDQGITFIDLLGDLTWTAKDAELRRADGAIDLHVALSWRFPLCQDLSKGKLAQGGWLWDRSDHRSLCPAARSFLQLDLQCQTPQQDQGIWIHSHAGACSI